MTLKLRESKVMVGNNNGLIDSISAEIKLNKEKFENEIERENISNVPQIHEEVETSVSYPVVEQGSRMTKKETICARTTHSCRASSSHIRARR